MILEQEIVQLRFGLDAPGISDNGKPAETRGRKATTLRGALPAMRVGLPKRSKHEKGSCTLVFRGMDS